MQEATLNHFMIMSTCKEIPFDIIRRNMWYEEPQNGPKNVYNHIRNEIKSADYGYATPPPHIIDTDGDYIHYENVGGYASVFAIGKIDISDDVVLIVLCSVTDENKKGEGRGSRQLYTFQKSTQQMLSAYVTDSENSFCIYIDNLAFICFEDYGNVEIDDDRTTDYRYKHRKLVKLLPNGYFAEKEIKTGIYDYSGYVQDDDGYANVRKAPSINSEVLYQVKNASYILAYGEPDSKWFEVVLVRELGQETRSAEKIGGYIHRSRLKNIEEWKNSLENTDIRE